MTAAKLKQNLRIVEIGRTLPRRGRWRIGITETPEMDLIDPYLTQYRIDVRVGVDLCGPAEAKEHLFRQAERLLVDELYGEINRELFNLLTMLWEEDYRPSSDPIMMQIEKLRKMTEVA